MPYPVNPDSYYSENGFPSHVQSWEDLWNLGASSSPLTTSFTNVGTAQFREWSQQMMATMYQNWYNSAPQQMQRALEAGINPFVAASGIAGADVGSVANAPNQVQNLPTSAAASIGNALSSLSSGVNNLVGAASQGAKLRHEISKIDAETASLFENLGFTKLQSKALSVQLKYLDKKEEIGVWQALANFDKTKAEYQNLLASHRNILAEYETIVAQADLLKAEKGDVVAAEQLKIAQKAREEEITRFAEIERKFFETHGFKLGTPIYESIRDMMVSNGSFDLESFGNAVASYDGKVSSAVESAKALASWHFRPSNAVELASWTSNNIANGSTWWQQLISKGVTKLSDAFNSVNSNPEFDEDYNEYRNELYSLYKQKKREFNRIKRGGNSQAVAQAENAMNNAYKAYKNCTKMEFLKSLMKDSITNFSEQ